ncbi:MAG: CARDB domain-containing protein, partial [Candidatus Thermoplasmatota archaeon]
TEVSLEAIPDEGQEFHEWTGTDQTGENITITMDEDKDITAHFIPEGQNPANFEVTIDSPEDGAEITKGNDVTVEFTVENTGDLEDTQQIVFNVDGEEVDTVEMTLAGNESDTGEFTWTADSEGDYTLEVASDDTDDSVDISVSADGDGDGDGIPGFTLLLLVLAAVIAVAIYYKKEE